MLCDKKLNPIAFFEQEMNLEILFIIRYQYLIYLIHELFHHKTQQSLTASYDLISKM